MRSSMRVAADYDLTVTLIDWPARQPCPLRLPCLCYTYMELDVVHVHCRGLGWRHSGKCSASGTGPPGVHPRVSSCGGGAPHLPRIVVCHFPAILSLPQRAAPLRPVAGTMRYGEGEHGPVC